MRGTVRQRGAGDELGLRGGTQRTRTQITENLSHIRQTTTTREPSPPRIRLDMGRRAGLGGPGSEGCRRSGTRRTETRPPQTQTQHTTDAPASTIHTQCTPHWTNNPPPSPIVGEVRGRLPAAPEPEDSTHNNTLNHNTPAQHPPTHSKLTHNTK